MKYLQKHGYKVIPVNPSSAGQKYWVNFVMLFEEIPLEIDMVNIFRPSKFCPSITKEAIKIGAKTIWMQLGIISEEAIELAKQNNKNAFLIMY